MAEWKLIAEDAAREMWNERLSAFADCSPFQTFEWGQYHKALGWEPCYFLAEEAGEPTAMLLGLLRRFPLKTGLMWCPGGPVGDASVWGENLHASALAQTKLKRLYLRFRCDRERDVNDVMFLGSQNWTRSLFSMTSCVSLELDLSVGKEKLLAQFARNWRRNLKAADAVNDLQITLCASPDVKEICGVYEEMEQRKNLPQQFSREKIEKLFDAYGSKLIFYRCTDLEGNLLCFRGCLLIGDRAVDYLAAATERGRQTRASYAVLWKLLEHCRERGVRFYDLGGIDFCKNPGVYKFKKETGARQIEYLGEWDWASQPWLRLLGNWAIWQKQKIRKVESFSVLNRLPLKSILKESPSQQQQSNVSSTQLFEAKNYQKS